MYSIYADGNLVYSDVYPNGSRKVTSPNFKMAVDSAGSLEFTMYPDNAYYNLIKRIRSKIEVRRFGKPIWIGRATEESIDFDNNKQIFCEGSYAFLNDTCQPLKEFKNVTFEAFVTAVLDRHNARYNTETELYRKIFFGGQTVTNDTIEYIATAYEYTIDIIKKLLEKYECHCVIKVEDDGHGNYVNKIYFFKEYMNFSGQSVQFGKNLLDFTRKKTLGDIATCILPLAKTDREPTDDPIAIGTKIDVTESHEYDFDGKGYGVLMPCTKGFCMRENTDKKLVLNAEIQSSPAVFNGSHVPPVVSIGKISKALWAGTWTAQSGKTGNGTLNIRRYTNDSGDAVYEPWYFTDGLTVPSYVKIYPSVLYTPYNSISWDPKIKGWDRWTISKETHEQGSPYVYASVSKPVSYPWFAEAYQYQYEKTDSIGWSRMLDGTDNGSFQSFLEGLNPGPIVPAVTLTRYSTDISKPLYILRNVDRHRITIVELDPVRYKAFYLTATRSEASYALVTIYKRKKNYAGQTFIPYEGFDDEPDRPDNLKGCEYWNVHPATRTKNDYPALFGMTARVSIGRKPSVEEGSSVYTFYSGDNDQGVHTTETITCSEITSSFDSDNGENIDILNPDYVVFHKAYGPNKDNGEFDEYANRIAFEKKFELKFTDEDLQNYDRAIVVIASDSVPDINIVTEEEYSRIISIGANTKDISTDKQLPERYKLDDDGDQWQRNASVGENDIFDATKGYGIMNPVNLGTLDGSFLDEDRHFRIMNETEMDSIGKANVALNIAVDGSIYSPLNTDHTIDIIQPTYQIQNNYDKYSIVVYVLQMSYEYTDAEGETHKEPNSVYLSTEMYGKSGIYAVFATENLSADKKNWVPGHRRWLEEIAFGKYINGVTKYENKKITLPYSKTKNEYCLLVASGFDTTPTLCLHDPNDTQKSQYLTIAPVNSSDLYLYSRSDNIFATDYDYGQINDVTGEDSYEYGNKHLRTSEYIPVKEYGYYSFYSYYREEIGSESVLSAILYIYDETKRLIDIQNISNTSDIHSVGILQEGYYVRAVFTKIQNGSEVYIELNDLVKITLVRSPMTTIDPNSLVNGTVKIENDMVVIDTTESTSEQDPWSDSHNVLITAPAIDLRNRTGYLEFACKHTDHISIGPGVSAGVLGRAYFITEINNPDGTSTKKLIEQSYYDLGPDMQHVTIPDGAVEVYMAFVLLCEYVDEEETRVFKYMTVDPACLDITYVSKLSKKPKYQVPNGALDTYGVIEKRVEFDDVYTATDLYNKAVDYLYVKQFDQVQLSVSALDLAILNSRNEANVFSSMDVGDALRVVSWPHGLNRAFAISSMSITLDNPESQKFTLGFDNAQSLTKILNRKRKD